MLVWIIKTGEPLPIDDNSPRLMRAGLLANALVDKGHEVLFWGSRFNHASKTMRRCEGRKQRWRPGGDVFLLDEPPYQRNLSLQRIYSHHVAAREFTKAAATEVAPNLILCCVPTLDLGRAATRYGREHGVPVVLDYRDLWPDIFEHLAPAPLRPLVRLAFEPYHRMAREAFSGATAITGITPEFVDWALRFARRPRNRFDRDFPHGYPDRKIDPAALEAAARFWRSIGVTPDDGVRTFCYVGQLSSRIELPTLRDTFQILKSRNVPTRLVLCGVGSEQAACRSWAADLGNVVMPGFIDAPQIGALMAMSVGGLIPYPSAPDFAVAIPNKAIEYMAGGLPILSSVQGVLSALIEREAIGLTYPNRNAAALAEGIEALVRAPERGKEMGARSRALFTRGYVAENVYREFAGHLEAIAASCKGAPHA